MTGDCILRTTGLTKCFLDRKLFQTRRILAVDCLDLEVRRGEVFGFLGPNGAGKTTALNMIVGLTEPTAGAIEIFGAPFRSGETGPLARIGYVPEATSLPGYFTIAELLDFYGQLFGLSFSQRRERGERLLEMVGLTHERNVLIGKLSMGQRRLVDLLQALINDPELILLDEPTVYLDPLILERVRAILLTLRAQGKTIVMSSHMLSEIEKLSDRVAVIHRGRLAKVGPKEEFLRNGTMEEEFLRIVKTAGG